MRHGTEAPAALRSVLRLIAEDIRVKKPRSVMGMAETRSEGRLSRLTASLSRYI
jgi:hypothetical protein